MAMVTIKDISEYIVTFIAAFATRYSISEAQAYKYLNKYDAIKVLHNYYDVMHTQSFADMVDSMTLFCRRKGGELC